MTHEEHVTQHDRVLASERLQPTPEQRHGTYPKRIVQYVCPRCDGEGEIVFNPGYPDPQTEDSETCSRCFGTGILRSTA